MSSQARILVVDDEKTLRYVVSRALAKLGHECVTATNGKRALAVMSKQAFDLVITDLKMPRMDGLTLIGFIRKVDARIPIIIMTGHGDLESARKAFRLGVSDFLVKPFESLAEVQIAVQRTLKKRDSRADAEVLVQEFKKRAQEFGRRERHLTHTLERAKVEIDGLARRLERSEAVAGNQVEQIDTMIENLENGILVTDAKGIVVSMNHELRKQLQTGSCQGAGYSVDRLPGDSLLRGALIESQERLRMGIEEPVHAQTTDASGKQHTYEVRSRCLGRQDDSYEGIATIVRPARLKPAKSEATAPAGPNTQRSEPSGHRRAGRTVVAPRS